MTEIYLELLQKFRGDPRVNALFPSTEKAQQIVQRHAKQWQDYISIMKFHDLPIPASDYDRAWIFHLTTRSDHKRRKGSGVPVMVVEINSISGQLLIARSSMTVERLLSLKSDPWAFMNHVHKHVSREKGTVDSLHAFNRLAISIAAGQFAKRMRSMVDPLNMQRGTANTLYDVGKTIAQNFLEDMVGVAIREINALIDQDALRFASALTRDREFDHLKNNLDIYNHIVAVPAKEARVNRMNGLSFMARTRHLFLSNMHKVPYDALWAPIDAGASPVKTFAQWAGVSPGTIRNIMALPDLPPLGMELPSVAQYLEKITPNRWPKNPAEFAMFSICQKTAAIYAATFGGDAPDILRQWVKESGPRASWKRIAFRRQRKQIAKILKTPRITNLLGYKPVDANPDTFVPDLNFIRTVIDRPKIWKIVLERYQSELKDIQDMKRDVSTRVIKAAAVLEFNKRGLEIADARLFDVLAEAAGQVMWDKPPPSEQLEASSYWHSPRIRFSQRFNALSQGDLKWHSMLAGPVALENGVVAHPLESSAALREEVDAMQHCVWSYAHSCLEDGYHIFSLRDKDGKRLSTLNLVDKTLADGSRHVSDIQNKAWDNRTPSADALKAAQLLVERINDKKIDLQWDMVDQARASYKAQKINLSIGYDVHNPAIRQSVYELYGPCLPRRVHRLSQGLFDQYAQATQLPVLVEALIARKPHVFLPIAPITPQ